MPGRKPAKTYCKKACVRDGVGGEATHLREKPFVASGATQATKEQISYSSQIPHYISKYRRADAMGDCKWDIIPRQRLGR